MKIFCTSLVALSFSTSAFAFECDNEIDKAAPSWVNKYGLNTDPKFMFGYAQIIPQKNQSLQEINEQLKANALADLSTSINSEVSRTIVSRRDNLGNDQAVIQSSAESNISTGQLSSSDSFIDQKECIAYARVAIEKANIPFISAVSFLRLLKQKTIFNTVKLSEIDAANGLLETLPDIAAQAGPSATAQLASLTPELKSIETEVNSRKIDILASSLATFSGSKRKELELAEEILALIEKIGQTGQSSTRHANQQKIATQTRDAISQILATNKIAVGWIRTNEAVDEAIRGVIENSPEKYWAAPTRSDAEGLKKMASGYELKRILYLELSTTKSRKFGIDEVDITLQLINLPIDKNISPKTQTVKGKAIGRPISDEIIAEKVSGLLKSAL